MKRVIGIDGDILAYKVAAINEEEIDFGEGGIATSVNPEKVVSDVKDIIASMVRATDADDFRVCLSDPKKNWRKSLEPTYKEHRKATKKPVLLDDVKAWLYGEYPSAYVEWLEADDVMGILATSPSKKREFVIVSEDKDMRTIPGLVYNPNHADLGVLEISRTDADQFLLWQTLVGDATDGYPGCPGVGKGGEYTKDGFVEGKKGSKAHGIFEIADPLEMWDFVIEAYAIEGRTEDDAIHQARMACICRHTNWNAQKKTVRLWNPTHLSY